MTLMQFLLHEYQKEHLVNIDEAAFVAWADDFLGQQRITAVVGRAGEPALLTLEGAAGRYELEAGSAEPLPANEPTLDFMPQDGRKSGRLADAGYTDDFFGGK